MGIAERREREKEQRKNDIIDAAEKVFFSKGLDLATMDDVAAEAELSKGTLYLYFKNKEELFWAINARGLDKMSMLFVEAISKHKTGLDKVKALGEAYYRFYLDYPDYFEMLLKYEIKTINKEEADECVLKCDKYGQKSIELVVSVIMLGQEDGTIRKDINPLHTAIILWGQLTGVIQILSKKGNHLQEEHGFNLDGLMDETFNFVYRALIL